MWLTVSDRVMDSSSEITEGLKKEEILEKTRRHDPANRHDNEKGGEREANGEVGDDETEAGDGERMKQLRGSKQQEVLRIMTLVLSSGR